MSARRQAARALAFGRNVAVRGGRGCLTRAGLLDLAEANQDRAQHAIVAAIDGRRLELDEVAVDVGGPERHAGAVARCLEHRFVGAADSFEVSVSDDAPQIGEGLVERAADEGLDGRAALHGSGDLVIRRARR